MSAVPSETEAGPVLNADVDDDVLVLDAHTFKDLEIFATETAEMSLFRFCNLSRTEGGAKVLRRRMEHPWASATRIRATQDSIGFILEHSQALTVLPSSFTARRVEHYMHEILPIVTHNNMVEFGIAAFDIWANHDRHYLSIVSGVQFTCAFIRSMRQFIAQEEMNCPVGELVPLIEELRVLLEHPGLAKIPEEATGGWVWSILRLDQVFRMRDKETIVRLLTLTYEIDALMAMADVTRIHNFVLPSIEQGPMSVHAEGLVHPYVEDAVANPVKLDQERRVLFLTGPNMAGKTTYLRAFATALYLAHLGMGVPARSFRFVPAQRLFSSISMSDDLRSGVSYFRAEALRVKAVAEAVAEGHRVVALMDEPFKGTNVKDALDASLAVLERFAGKYDCLFMFSSHLIELSERLDGEGQIDCRYFEADESQGRLRFDYSLKPGVSSQRLGMRVLREEGVFDLLDRVSTDI